MRNRMLVATSSLALLVLASAGVFEAVRPSSADRDGVSTLQRRGDSEFVMPRVFSGTPQEPGYPAEWLVGSVAEAQGRIGFELLLPNDPAANKDNVKLTYLFPNDSAVALVFPPPSSPESYIRQEYIEVYETQWFGGDPVEEFTASVEATAASADAIVEIDGVSVLTVTPRSPADDERANPALVRFVLNGIEIQVSGGESLDTVIAIARSIFASAPSVSPEPSPTESASPSPEPSSV